MLKVNVINGETEEIIDVIEYSAEDLNNMEEEAESVDVELERYLFNVLVKTLSGEDSIKDVSEVLLEFEESDA